jgi:hypothetical protein
MTTLDQIEAELCILRKLILAKLDQMADLEARVAAVERALRDAGPLTQRVLDLERRVDQAKWRLSRRSKERP